MPRSPLPALTVTVCFLALVACGDISPQSLCFGLATAPVSLDPRFATDAVSERISRLIYQRLVDFDAASRPVPALARWQVLGALHYRFVLMPPGAERLFHDGTRLTAADVKATYDSILDPSQASPHRASLASIRQIQVVDADTVDFFLGEPDLQFPGRLGIGILPARSIQADHPFHHQPVGSGPFAFLDWPADNRLRLKRLADGQVVEFIVVPDPTVRVLKLLRGEIDMLQNDLPPELVGYLSEKANVQVVRGRGSNLAYLGFNMEDPIVGRREVREAIAHAIDRTAIIRYVLGGAARSSEAVLPPEHWAGNRELTAYDHDPGKARALLRQAGFSERHPAHIVYKTSNDPFRVRLATLILQQLADVGLSVELRIYDWGTFYGDIKAGRFQMYGLTWVGVRAPDIFRHAFHSASRPPIGANRGRLADPLVDTLIEQAQHASDIETQAAIYRRLQTQLLDSLVYIPLWYEDHVFAARRDIQGYTIAPDGNFDALARVRRLSSALSVARP
jgi:peptide/nickel transport system substrate-binding protein